MRIVGPRQALGLRAPRWSRRAARPLAAMLALWVTSCSSPQPLAPFVNSVASLEGRTVKWTTTHPAIGAVRWSEQAGRYDHVSYPAAPSADRSYATQHSVPLLALSVGDSVYLQVLSRGSGGDMAIGPRQAFRVVAAPASEPFFTWTMIDVGFGDSHLLTLPTTRRQVLVDAGERRDAINVERYLDDRGIARLDAVLMTHVHEDHIGGMVGERNRTDDGVVGRYEIGALIEGPPPSAWRSAYDELVTLAAARAVPRRRIGPGDDEATNAALAWDPEVHVTVLHAGGGRALGGEDESNWINDDSVVLRIRYGSVAFVLGGDAESPVESRLLAGGLVLDASVLKVHHHGSANACDDGYLAAVHPRVGLVPITSYESYGGSLPSTIVLQRLRSQGADVYASDRAEPLEIRYTGDAGQNVTVVSDGRSYEVGVAPSASRHWSGTSAGATASWRSLP